MMWLSPCYLIYILPCPLLPIQFWNNSGHSRHSRKQTPEITDIAKPQNTPSNIIWTTPCYLIHILHPLIPIQFQKNSGLLGHSRKQTLEITYNSNPQNNSGKTPHFKNSKHSILCDVGKSIIISFIFCSICWIHW